jgi:hypothetical protein
MTNPTPATTSAAVAAPVNANADEPPDPVSLDGEATAAVAPGGSSLSDAPLDPLPWLTVVAVVDVVEVAVVDVVEQSAEADGAANATANTTPHDAVISPTTRARSPQDLVLTGPPTRLKLRFLPKLRIQGERKVTGR